MPPVGTNQVLRRVWDVGDRTSWIGQAACRGADPSLWFPERGEPTWPAKQICHACPVETQCLEWALTSGEKKGIFGGKSERERRRLRAARLKGSSDYQPVRRSGCGTPYGHQTHRRWMEPVCDDCLAAFNLHNRRKREALKRQTDELAARVAAKLDGEGAA